MRDQATELRNLVFQATRTRAATLGPSPRILLVAGGKGGVGATTISVNLGIALSDLGQRVVLIDADLRSSDVATLCGLSEGVTIADVMKSQKNIHEALQPGPAGMLIVPGCWASSQQAGFTEQEQSRLISQCLALGRHADIVLVDAGCGASEMLRHFWPHADEAILITTTEPVSVMDAYATVKAIANSTDHKIRIRSVVNKTVTSAEHQDIHRRLDHSCQRFLGVHLEQLGHVPTDGSLQDSNRFGDPLEHAQIPGAVSRAVEQLATQLIRTAAKPSRAAA